MNRSLEVALFDTDARGDWNHGNLGTGNEKQE